MENGLCAYHIKLFADFADKISENISEVRAIKIDVAYIKDRVCKHVEDGEKEGGYRDRLIIVETTIKELRGSIWRAAGVGGVIGALLGSGSRDILVLFINWIIGK